MAARNTWKKRLDPFAEKVYEITRMLHAMSTDDLKKLLKACDEPTQTNCGWAHFAIAPLVKSEAAATLMTRTKAEAKAKAKK